MRLGVKFNLPYRFIDENSFEFPVRNTSVKIMIKHIQNYEGAEKIMGVKIETSGEGAKVDMNPDSHGLINYSAIKMELSDKTECTLHCLLNEFGFNTDTAVKNICVLCLNRLVTVYRYFTNLFWIHHVNLRDILNFQLFDLSSNPPLASISIKPDVGYVFPNIRLFEISKVKDKIDKTLAEQSVLPIWKNLFLDSINYFTIGRYNESVINANIALESFVASYLYKKLNQKFPNNEIANHNEIRALPKSLHKILKKHFPNIDGRNFEKESGLWDKFDKVRVFVRTHAIHSFTKQIDEVTSFNTLNDIKEIISWIDPAVDI